MLREKVLIIGISGQDGSYLSRTLHKQGYIVYGTSRNPSNDSLQKNFQQIKFNASIPVLRLNPKSQNQVYQLIDDLRPDYIFNMSGQTSVNKSFNDNEATYQSIVPVVENILQAILKLNPKIKFLNAGSGEIFKAGPNNVITEDSEMKADSPYAEAKLIAFKTVKKYREEKDLFAVTAILFNHESILRPRHFVTKKVITSAIKILKGELDVLEVGDISLLRDWGWAPEYVDAMQRMLMLVEPEDFIISSGASISLESLIESIFSELNLNYKDFIQINKNFFRKNESKAILTNPSKIMEFTSWKSKIKGLELGPHLLKEYLAKTKTKDGIF